MLQANPSAVSGYDETKPDLLNNQAGNYQYLKDAEGHDDVRAFFEEVARQDADRAQKAHQLLGQLTSSTAGLQPSQN